MSERNEARTSPPLQNRVLPTGEIVSDPARGLLMGNRGCIHRPDRTLGPARWRTKMWISCVLVWRDVRRDVMPPGRWTALFFLDEATALAAGHRPCAYCRRGDYLYVVGLIVFGVVARSGQPFALAGLLTFLPVVPLVGLFWLLPETRGREPEDLWPDQ